LIITATGYPADTLNMVSTDSKLTIVLNKNKKPINKAVANSSQNPSSNSNTVQKEVAENTMQDTYQNMFNGQTTSSGINPVTNKSYSTFSNAPASGSTLSGTFLPSFSHEPETKGTRYLFDKWVGGVVLDTGNNVIDNKSYLFNYDKVSRDILLTQDMKKAIEINKDQVKAFALKDEQGTLYIFELIPAVNNGNFVMQLAKGNKYALYKSIKTKYVKADYQTDGMVEHGSPDNQYIDEFHYYVLKNDTKEVKEIEFKKKTIKAVFGTESDKVNTYFSQHADDDINEEFLKGLIIFLNK